MTVRARNIWIMPVLAGLLSPGATVGGEETDGYVAEIEEWHQARVERLQRPTGWFSLVGLYWLQDGENTVGADAANDVVFPEGLAPAVVGAFRVAGDKVTFAARDGVEVMSGEEIVASTEMYNDTDEENDLTVLELGSLNWYIIKRGEKVAVRLKDTDWASRREFRGIDSYAIDPRWRVEATLELHDAPTLIDITDITGMQSKQPTPGTLVFELDGKTCALEPVASPGDEDLFIIFADGTNGEETYGAGRFVYAKAPGEDGRVIIDFNKAYNPPCAFTDYATCPLPPPQNQLPVRITAGEKAYGHTAQAQH